MPTSCATAGSTLTFTSNGQIIGTQTVPAGGTGTLTLSNLNSGLNVTLPSGSGTLNAYVNGNACGTATLSSTTSTFTLPATCDVGGGTLTFRTATGGQVATSLTIPASGTGTLALPNLNSPLSVSVPAGTGSLNVLLNGQVCGTVALSTSVSTVTLPAACDVANGTLTFQVPGGGQLATTLTVPATGTGTVTLPNLTPATLSITLPAGAAGTITIMCGTTVGGTATISPTSTTTVDLNAACSVPGQTLTLVGPANINAAGTLNVPATITTTPLVVPSLNSSNPLTITLPAGNGTVIVMEGGIVCGSATLSPTTTTAVTLALTCQVPNQTIAFVVNGTPSSTTLTVPVSGAGPLAVATLGAQVVPAPAKTGNAGLIARDTTSPWLVLALGALAMAAVAARAVTRKRA